MSTATDLNDAEQMDITADNMATGISAADASIPTPAAPAATLDPVENSTGEKELPRTC